MRRGGVKFDDAVEVRRWAARTFGLDDFPSFSFEDPVSSGGFGS
jgi:hypothetical protein